MDSSSQTRSKAPPVFRFAGFILLFGYFYTVFSGIERNADHTGNYYAAVEWFRGNWNLRNWVLPPDHFLNSDLLLYGLLSKVFGVRIEVCYYSAALLWTGVVSLALLLTRRLAPKGLSQLATLSVFLGLGLPVIEGNPELALLSFSPLHIGSILYLAGACACLCSYLKVGKTGWLAAYALLLGLDCFGDPMIVVQGALPALVTVAYHLLLGQGKDARLWRLLGATLLAVAGGEVLLLLLKSHGFKSPLLPISFVSFERFRLNLQVVARAPFVFAGADFWGHLVTLKSLGVVIILLLHLPLVGFHLACLSELTWIKFGGLNEAIAGKGNSDQASALESLLYFIVLFTVAAALLSSVVQDVKSLRYLLPGYVFLNVLTAARYSRYKLFSIYTKLCFAATLVFSLVVYLPQIGSPPKGAAGDQHGLVSKLLELDLRDGFGCYWDATTTTVLSCDRILTRPVSVQDKTGLRPYIWTSTTDWFTETSYRQDQFFVITRPAEKPEYITRELAIRTFGQPKSEFDVWDCSILVYDRASASELLKTFEREAQADFARL